MVKIYLIAFSLFFANALLASGLKSFSSWASISPSTATVSSGSTVKTNSTFYDYSLVPKYQKYMKGFWCANTIEATLNDGQPCEFIQDRSVTFWSNTPSFADNLSQSISAETPSLETSSAYNDWPICRFDGIDDNMSTDHGTQLSQRYMVCGVLTGSIGAGTRAVIFNAEVSGVPYGRLWNGIYDGYAGSMLAGSNTANNTEIYSYCYTFANFAGRIDVSGAAEATGTIGLIEGAGLRIYERSGPGGFNMRGIFYVMGRYDLSIITSAQASEDWLNFTVARYGPMDQL